MYICTYVHMCIDTYVHIYIYIYIYVYTQTWEFPKMGVPKDGWFIMDNPSINE